MKKILVMFLCLVVSGCASPCMKKDTVLEMKQCKWEKRQKRDENILGVSGILSLVSLPMVAMCVFSTKCSPMTLPVLGTAWGLGMSMYFDMEFLMGPYPRKPNLNNPSPTGGQKENHGK